MKRLGPIALAWAIACPLVPVSVRRRLDRIREAVARGEVHVPAR
jgi:hypothetical protein